MGKKYKALRKKVRLFHKALNCTDRPLQVTDPVAAGEWRMKGELSYRYFDLFKKHLKEKKNGKDHRVGTQPNETVTT